MKKKIILDCDPGHDDAVAIMLAAASEKIQILGLTCVAGNSTLKNTKINALKICSLIKKTDIKIYSGAAKPLNLSINWRGFSALYIIPLQALIWSIITR